MKRIHNKLYLVLTMLVMAFTISFVTYKSSIKIIAGGTANPVSGMYMKVKDDNPIEVGDHVLIASTSRAIMDGAGGNPGYITGNTTGFLMSDNKHEGHLQDSDDRIFANYSDILEFEVCQGSKEGTFAFKTQLASLGASEKNVTAYLAYTPDDGSCHHYYGIAYWQCSTGFDDGGNKDNEAWVVTYDTDHGITEMKNYVSNSYLKYRASSGARIWFGLNGEGGYNRDNVIGINLYKKVVGSTILEGSVSQPTKSEYKPGEEIDLSGLHFNFRYNDSKTTRDEIIYFDDEKDLFSYPSYVYNSGVSDYEVEYLGHKFYVNLNVNDYSYQRLENILDDYSGVIVLIKHDTSDYYVPNGLAIGDESSNAPYKIFTDNLKENGKYFSTFYGSVNDVTWNEAASFIVSFDGYNYYIKNYDGKYLRKDENGTVYLSSEIGDPVYFSLVDGITYIKLVGTNETLCLDNYELKYVSNQTDDRLVVYKASLKSDVIDEVNEFVNHVSNTVFEFEEGRRFSLNSLGYIKNAFNDLSPIAKAYVTNINYTHNNEIENSIEDIMDVYDNTITRRSDDFEDFINRKVTYSYLNIIEGLINEIGTVSLDKENLISDARKAYDNLTYTQRERISSDLVDTLEAAEERIKVLKTSITALQQEAIVGEYTYVRFIFIINGNTELTSSDFENKLSIILDEGLYSEQSIERTPNVYTRITQNGNTYVSNVNDMEYTFDNSVNEDDIYIVYVIQFTTEKYLNHNVKAKLVFDETEYKTSGYDFV